MTSLAQRTANERNAHRSTGPRTAAGKAAAARNSVTHGLCAHDVTLPDEDPRAWDAHRDALYQHFAPVGPMEEQCVERLAVCGWRLTRVTRIETSVFQYQTLDQRARDTRRTAMSFERPSPLLLTELKRDVLTTTITDEASYAAALTRATEAETARDHEPLAAAFVNDAAHGHPLAKLSRYEVALERSQYRALHELERLQAARRAHPGDTGTPTVIDVNVSPPAES